jgi:hypothetical protein
VRRDTALTLHEPRRRIGRWRGWQLRRSCRDEETLTVLGPYAATGVETGGVVRGDRSTAREFTDKNVCFAAPHWRWDGHIFAASALDHGCRCGEHDEHHGGDPQDLFWDEKRAHQWNI